MVSIKDMSLRLPPCGLVSPAILELEAVKLVAVWHFSTPRGRYIKYIMSKLSLRLLLCSFIYCRSGNIREILFLRNSRGRKIQESRENYY